MTTKNTGPRIEADVDSKLGNPIFLITDETVIDTAWFVPMIKADWMALLYCDTPDAPWRVTYRFRYHHDKKVWGSDDEKSVYEIKANDNTPETAAKLREGMDTTCALIHRMQGDPAHKPETLRVNGGMNDFIKLSAGLNFMHFKVIPPESSRVM